jgi:hypothetical protein
MCNKQAVQIISLLIIVLALPIGSNTSTLDMSNDELLIYNSIVELYIKGLEIRDFELIRTICVPDAQLMSVDDADMFHVTSLDEWSKRFDPDRPPFRTLEHSILKIDVAGTAAQVKILFIVDGNRQVIDYLHMLKLEGKWRIANIIDSQTNPERYRK